MNTKTGNDDSTSLSDIRQIFETIRTLWHTYVAINFVAEDSKLVDHLGESSDTHVNRLT